MSKHNSAIELTRRGFLVAGSAVALGALAGCGSGGGDSVPPDMTKAYRLSTRGVGTASNAAKLHAANLRFVSAAAADANRAHAGDRSNIVPIDIKPATWELWFGGGAGQVDLRKI